MKSSRFTRSADSDNCTVGDSGSAQPDVVRDGSGEQMRILQHHAEIAAQIFDIEIADIDAADAYAAALDLVESQQQAGERGLPRPGVSHHGDGLARLDAEAHIGDHPVFIFVREPDAIEFDGRRAAAETAWCWARRLDFAPACPAA